MKAPSLCLLVSLGAVGVLTAACNLFGALDGAGGDTQLLSAARACLDRGDTACALSNYQKLSPNQADIAASETAYAMLDAQGAGMVAFSDFIATVVNNSADTGKAITRYAEKLASTAGAAKRNAIFEAYKQRDLISTGNTKLRAFVQFTAGLALAAELLAEATTGDGILKKNNIVTDATLCPNTTFGAGCATNVACAKPASSNLTDVASTDFDSGSSGGVTAAVTGDVSAAATMDLVFFAIKHANDGLSNLGASGTGGNIAGSFTTISGNGKPSTTPPATSQCFRATLLSQGIGE